MKKVNIYNLFDTLYYYRMSENKIISFKVFAITCDEAGDGKIKYNYLYRQDECFLSRQECYNYAKKILEEKLQSDIKELIND